MSRLASTQSISNISNTYDPTKLSVDSRLVSNSILKIPTQTLDYNTTLQMMVGVIKAFEFQNRVFILAADQSCPDKVRKLGLFEFVNNTLNPLGRISVRFPSDKKYLITDLAVKVSVNSFEVYIASRCDIPSNGGIFVIKNLSFSDFNNSSISPETGVDGQKALFRLQDYAINTLTEPCGLAINNNLLYCLTGKTSIKFAIFDTSLSHTSNVSNFKGYTSSYTLTEDVALQANLVKVNNDLLFVSKSILYKQSLPSPNSALSLSISNENCSIGNSNSLCSISYNESISKCYVATGSLRGSYTLEFNGSWNSFTHNETGFHSSKRGSELIQYSTHCKGVSFFSNGVVLGKIPDINTNSISYSMDSLLGEFEYIAVFPKISLAEASKLYNVLSDGNVDLYYRTNGINNNTGSWTMSPSDLSSLGVTDFIQFGVKFRRNSELKLLSLIYEDSDPIPSQFYIYHDDCSTDSGTIGFIQKSMINKSPIVLKISYLRYDNDAQVFEQDSLSNTFGKFQWLSSSTWVDGVGGDVLDLRRRFVPHTVPPIQIYPRIEII
jgi:hypothetical protein